MAEKYQNEVLNIGIRCNYDIEDGVRSRFGFDIDSEDYNRVINFVNEYDNLNLINFQCHFAKRQIEYWPARAKGMIAIIDKLGVIPQKN